LNGHSLHSSPPLFKEVSLRPYVVLGPFFDPVPVLLKNEFQKVKYSGGRGPPLPVYVFAIILKEDSAPERGRQAHMQKSQTFGRTPINHEKLI